MWYLVMVPPLTLALLGMVYFLLLPGSRYHYAQSRHTGMAVRRNMRQERDQFGWGSDQSVGRIPGDWTHDRNQWVRNTRLPA